MPYILCIIFVMAILHYFFEGGRLTSFIKINSKCRFWTWFIILIITILLGYSFSNSKYFQLLVLIASFVVFRLIEYAIKDLFEDDWYTIFIISILIASSFAGFGLGVSGANTEFSGKHALVNSFGKNYLLIKKLQEGALVYQDNKKTVVFIKNEKIDSITFKVN